MWLLREIFTRPTIFTTYIPPLSVQWLKSCVYTQVDPAFLVGQVKVVL